MKKKDGLIILGIVAALVTIGFFATRNRPATASSGLLPSLFGARTTAAAPKPAGNYVAQIWVQGVIQSGGQASPLTGAPSGYDHRATVSYVKSLAKDPNNKGIFLELDTPGGGVYESDELYLALLDYKKETGRPVQAYMRSQAASGGYYLAMAADKVWANRNTITGSIGVIMSRTDLSGLYQKLGIATDPIASGQNKAMGAPDKPLTPEQRAIFQSIVDEAYNQFVSIVAEGRKLPKERVIALADGRIYTAAQAKAAGLVDDIKDHDTALQEFCDGLSAQPYTPTLRQTTLWQQLFSEAGALKPKSEAEIFLEVLQRFPSDKPLYLYMHG